GAGDGATRQASDPDEGRVLLPDGAHLDRLARTRRVDLLVPTEVDGDVAGGPDEVAGLGLRAGDDLADVALGARALRELLAGLAVHVAGEARAVEAGARARAADAVLGAHELLGDAHDRGATVLDAHRELLGRGSG